ncbi:hypothetical protein [Bacillus sp. J33]|nr:hypothetical protein [Bacillus sp. J33]
MIYIIHGFLREICEELQLNYRYDALRPAPAQGANLMGANVK